MKQLIVAVIALVALSSTAEARRHHHWHHHHRAVHYASSGSVVSHPFGCPRSAFCGCAAAVEVFGHPVRELYLAAAWLKYPRTAPAPGMVAARRGHVFVLRSQTASGHWLVYDGNSGGGLTRVHERSLAGYQIVNPRASG